MTKRAPVEKLADGAALLSGFAAAHDAALIREIQRLEGLAPFRNMVTPGGFQMSVAMTNCGEVGWVTDHRGYRYEPVDPISGRAWPPLGGLFTEIASAAAQRCGFRDFAADTCLVNRYHAAARLSLHQDKNERDLAKPIVSVSLGLSALFLFGTQTRSDRPRKIHLENGDVVVWGGASRLAFHGVASVARGRHILTDRFRYNLTFRQAL